jgi:hypothetical protein
MSLFSPASSQGQDQAAYMGALLQTQMAAEAQKSITGYGGQAIDALTGGYGAARGALTQNFDPALAAINTGYGSARGDVTTNYGLGQDRLSKAIAGYDPYVQAGNSANAMQLNALGLGGPTGYSSAMGAFNASPQYQWNLDQATGNAVRGANRYGMATGGNTMDAITRLGSNLASGEFNNWLTNLNTVAGRGLTAVGGQGGLLNTSGQLYANLGNNLGNLDTGQGTAVGSLYSGLGSGLAGLFGSEATGKANIYGNEGSQIANVQTGLGNNLAGAYSRAADADAAAAAANRQWQTGLLGAGLRLGGAALTGGATGGAGLGLTGLGTGLFNPFGETAGIRGA